jgi:hypothetical protein
MTASRTTAKSSCVTLPADSVLARELARTLRHALGDILQQASLGTDDRPALAVASAARATAPTLLANSHPGDGKVRREARGLYERYLQHYRHQVQATLMPGRRDDDLGMAAAYFTMANLATLQNLDHLDQAVLAAVERQMRHLIGSTPSWHASSLADRQCLFEQLAVLGVLINDARLLARRQGAAALAHVQGAARTYLIQLLGLDPDQLTLTHAGLATGGSVH